MNRLISITGLTAVVLLLYIIFPAGIFAAQPGGQAGAFLRMGLAPDRIAMGDCGVAMTSGAMNWYYNPAGLPAQKKHQAAIGYRFMSLDREIMYAGYSTPLKPHAGLAFGVLRAGTGDIPMTDSNGEQYETTSFSENVIHGSFALQPHPIIALGLSIKWLIAGASKVKEDDKSQFGYAMSIDFGAQLRASKSLRFGFQARDLGAQYNWETSETWGDEIGSTEDPIPSLLRLGAAWDPIDDLTLATDVILDADRAGDESSAIEPHFGAEYRTPLSNKYRLALRMGYDSDVITSGFGIDIDLGFAWGEMNYAFYNENIAPDSAHLIGWVFRF